MRKLPDYYRNMAKHLGRWPLLTWLLIQAATGAYGIQLALAAGDLDRIFHAVSLAALLAAHTYWIAQLFDQRTVARVQASSAEQRFYQACQDFTVLDDAYKELAQQHANQKATILGFGEIERWREAHRQHPHGGEIQ